MKEFLKLSNLTIFNTTPEYVFAMKCMAARTDADAKDVEDTIFLLKHLGIKNYQEAEQILLRYFSSSVINIKTQLLLEEIIENM